MGRFKKELSILSSLLLVLALVASAILSTPVLASPYPYNSTDTEVASALDYLRGQQTTDGDIGGFGPSAWVTMAIAAAGEDPHNWKVGSNPSIVDYLAANANSANSTADYERMILAITAANEGPINFGSVDFVAQLEANYDGIQIGDASLLNDDFWGVMALISAGESPSSEIIANSVAFIKDNQNDDGGWSWGVGGDSDVDDTTAALMALIAAGENSNSSPITNALAYIKSQQANNGGFLSWGNTNADTDSWAIDAIVAAGQDPTSANWTESGNTPIDDLLTFQQGDGSFYWQSGTPGMSVPKTTASVIQALVGKPYPVKVQQPEEGMPVYVRVEGQSSTIWRGNVIVSESTIIDDAGNPHHLADPTALGALDEASNAGRFPYTVHDFGWALAITSIDEAGNWDNGPWWVYRVDYYPVVVGADSFILNVTSPPPPPHQEVLFYTTTTWSELPLKISVNKTAVDIEEAFTATVCAYNDTSHGWSPCEGATVHADQDYTTSDDGTVDISIANEGTYDIFAEKDGYVRSDSIGISVTWTPWVYDTNPEDGYIEIGELLHAIGDYIGGNIDIGQLLNLIYLYIGYIPKL